MLHNKVEIRGDKLPQVEDFKNLSIVVKKNERLDKEIKPNTLEYYQEYLLGKKLNPENNKQTNM